MALTMDPRLLTALGLAIDIYGMLGGVTFRRARTGGNLAYFERRHPGARSPAQQYNFDKWQWFWAAYRLWDLNTVNNWEYVANFYSTRMIGSHLALKVWWAKDVRFLEIAKRDTGIDLVVPDPYPGP